MNSKQINCCNLTQLCAVVAQFHHDKLKASNQNDRMDYFSFGAIDTIWNLYINLRDNQVLCEWCLKFSDQLVKFRNDLGKRSGEKLCEFCGRTIWGSVIEYKIKNNLIEIPKSKYCCSKQINIIDETKIVFDNTGRIIKVR